MEFDRHGASAADRRYAPARRLRCGAGCAPGASWRDARPATGSARSTGPTGRVACRPATDEPDGGSGIAGARLRRGVLAGGYAAWSEARLPLVDKATLDRLRAEAAQPVGDAAAAEDRPHRLPVADPPLPRRRGAHPVRRSARGAGGREGNRRDPVRHRRRRDFARGPALLVRHHAQAVRSGGRAVAAIASR